MLKSEASCRDSSFYLYASNRINLWHSFSHNSYAFICGISITLYFNRGIVSSYSEDGCDINEVIEASDNALLKAKSKGKNRVEAYTRYISERPGV